MLYTLNGLSDFLASFEDKEKEDAPKPKKVIEEEKPVQKIEKEKPVEKEQVKLKLNFKKEIKAEEKEVKKEVIEEEIPEAEKEVQEDPMSIDFINKLFIESETDPSLKAEWIDYYEKGIRSRKKTQTVNKLISGRFRIKENGEIEILPDLKTKNKSVAELLSTKWV